MLRAIVYLYTWVISLLNISSASATARPFANDKKVIKYSRKNPRVVHPLGARVSRTNLTAAIYWVETGLTAFVKLSNNCLVENVSFLLTN